MPLLDEPERRRWRAAADEALASARQQQAGGFVSWACFMAEQAAQLAVKGTLHGAGTGAWGHDLVVLVRRLAETGGAVPDAAQEAAARLSRHYIPSRYPDAHPLGTPSEHYTQADATTAIQDAETVIVSADAVWEELQHAEPPDSEPPA